MFLKIKKGFGGILILLLSSSIFANGEGSKIFTSNNTREISLEKAYERLTSQPQADLIKNMIQVFQRNHLEQGSFESVMTIYQVISDKNVTSDNAEVFETSSYQNLSDKKIFFVAKQLAATLKQESVAVFIPRNKPQVGEVILYFPANTSTDDALKIIHKKLPQYYNQVYSLHFSHVCSNFNSAKVLGVEWIGSHINLDEIRKAFPEQRIFIKYGNGYLVYKNGFVKEL